MIRRVFKASYCHYLIGDPHILFFLFVFLLEKSLGFGFKEILINQTWGKPKKKNTYKSKDKRFPIRTMYPVYFKIEFGDSGFSCEKWIRRVLKSLPQKF